MDIEFDEAKRKLTLHQRGLDFADAIEVFAGRHYTLQDTRQDYAEPRFITVGKIRGRMVVMAWTLRGGIRHIISLRKANEREQARDGARVD